MSWEYIAMFKHPLSEFYVAIMPDNSTLELSKYLTVSLNEMGASGWELVTSVGYERHNERKLFSEDLEGIVVREYILKREIPSAQSEEALKKQRAVTDMLIHADQQWIKESLEEITKLEVGVAAGSE